MMETLLTKAKTVIEKIDYLNIASLTPAGLPWNSPVYISYDNKLNFYWMSWKDNQHSINIHNNGHIFATIYDSTATAGTGFGVYLQGTASVVTNPVEMLVGLKTHHDRSKSKMRAIEKFLEKFPRRIYKFVPEKVWVNGDAEIEGEPIDVRTEINLTELKELFYK